MEDMIDITGADMVTLVREAYALSKPQGMGMLHFKPGTLDEAQAKEIASAKGEVSMDYVNGRAIKLHVFEREGRHYITRRWFDHTPEDLRDLLRSIGMEDKAEQVEA